MKKRTEVKTTISAFSVNTKELTGDNSAWTDLILSKTALVFATVVVLAAVYSLAASSSDIVKKNELEVITLDLTSNIDSIGSIHSNTDKPATIYFFDTSSRQLIDNSKLKISVSGEYVSSTFADNGRNMSAVRTLSYRTLPFSPDEFRNMLNGKFAADGNINHPVHSLFPYTDVTDFLAIAAADDLSLNTSKGVRIEKTSVFVTDGNEVNELEYILVYQ
ncbi:hypothetical protein [Methanolobus psychrotolerans]|uniref:hypothetical protein n=1 Tax=Methanolobus psychrotolerans TaxID=1874706 RepID=UPI000B91B981|nr:hypothetical protein [Methanolobus psychrotolerans]